MQTWRHPAPGSPFRQKYLFGVHGGVQGAPVVVRVHHANVIQNLLQAVDAAALAARADRRAGYGVTAAQAVHLAAGRLTVLRVRVHKVTICTCPLKFQSG